MKTPVRDQVNALDAAAYFTLLAELMKRNPPRRGRRADAREARQDRHRPGQDFDAAKLDPALAKRDRRKLGFDRIMLHFKISERHQDVNGWGFTTKTGLYGTDYLQRALRHRDRARRQPAAGRGLSDLAEATPTAKRVHGRREVRACASRRASCHRSRASGRSRCTTSYFFVDNPINRYSISPRQDLKSNADGSVDLYIQNESPGRTRSPTGCRRPKGKFIADAAALLAEGERSLDPERHLDRTRGRDGRLSTGGRGKPPAPCPAVWTRPAKALGSASSQTST